MEERLRFEIVDPNFIQVLDFNDKQCVIGHFSCYIHHSKQ